MEQSLQLLQEEKKKLMDDINNQVYIDGSRIKSFDKLWKVCAEIEFIMNRTHI